jgi:hypothetical protein
MKTTFTLVYILIQGKRNSPIRAISSTDKRLQSARLLIILLQLTCVTLMGDRLCGLVVRVLGYRSGGTGSIPGTTRKKSSGSGTGSTQAREYN